ncbi:MAG: acylphosphatase, partial [Deferrisomatales bacterium]
MTGPARRFLRVQGIVQGVGFRPFVARLAAELGLSGHVENTTRGVELEVQGPGAAVRAFEARLVSSPPPMAAILEVEAADLEPRPGDGAFAIRASREDPVASAVIPPDIATCGRCRAELEDPADRRHAYPFLNCTDCGPRYTIIRSIPYDRARTAMDRFPLCAECRAEYEDPSSRRFHAQPNACPACGPRLALRGAQGEPLAGDPVDEAVATLARGGIVALLGLGGFHLACDAAREDGVAELRRRKTRPLKPLAVMVPDLDAAGELVELNPEAAALRQGPRAPIVRLPARAGAGVA